MSTPEKNPIVVICGGTAGVGRATALEFAKAGYHLGIIAREEKGLEDTLAELKALGARTVMVSADVADHEAIDRAAEKIEKELGPIDVWVNSAMATVFGPVEKLGAAEIHRVTDVTYHGFVNGTLAALRYMKPRNRGTIVQVGSALSYRAIPLQSAYCGAKFAIRGFTDSVRCELIHDNSKVRITMVQLPAHNTPQFDWSRNKMDKRPMPVPPIYRPEVAARAIFRAAREAPRELWVGKAAFQSIIGNMVMPGVLDRMLSKQAWDGQMDDEDKLDRADNLFEPVNNVHRMEGRFSEQAKDHAVALSSTVTRSLLGGAAMIFALGALAVAASTKR